MPGTTRDKTGAVVNRKSGWRKWGSRLGKFLTMGGWIVVLLLIVGIVVAAQTCGR